MITKHDLNTAEEQAEFLALLEEVPATHRTGVTQSTAFYETLLKNAKALGIKEMIYFRGQDGTGTQLLPMWRNRYGDDDTSWTFLGSIFHFEYVPPCSPEWFRQALPGLPRTFDLNVSTPWLVSALNEKGKLVLANPNVVSGCFKLPTTFEEYLAALPKKYRSNMRAVLRKNSDLRIESDCRVRDSDMATIIEEYRAYWEESAGTTVMDTHVKIMVDLELMRQNPLNVIALYVYEGTRLVAANFGYQSGGRLVDLVAFRSMQEEDQARHLGIFCILKNVELCCNLGLSTYNLSSAAEEETVDTSYKPRFVPEALAVPQFAVAVANLEDIAMSRKYTWFNGSFYCATCPDVLTEAEAIKSAASPYVNTGHALLLHRDTALVKAIAGYQTDVYDTDLFDPAVVEPMVHYIKKNGFEFDWSHRVLDCGSFIVPVNVNTQDDILLHEMRMGIHWHGTAAQLGDWARAWIRAHHLDNLTPTSLIWSADHDDSMFPVKAPICQLGHDFMQHLGGKKAADLRRALKRYANSEVTLFPEPLRQHLPVMEQWVRQRFADTVDFSLMQTFAQIPLAERFPHYKSFVMRIDGEIVATATVVTKGDTVHGYSYVFNPNMIGLGQLLLVKIAQYFETSRRFFNPGFGLQMNEQEHSASTYKRIICGTEIDVYTFAATKNPENCPYQPPYYHA